jgi:hypothetical protein
VASKRQGHRNSAIGAEILAGAAIGQHQLDSVRAPEQPTAEIVRLSSEFVGRPISKWSKDLQLAEMMNDRLSRTVHVRVA